VKKTGSYGYITTNYNFRPIDCILSGKCIKYEEPDKVFIKDITSTFKTPSPVASKRYRQSTPHSNAKSAINYDNMQVSDESDEEDVRSGICNMSLCDI